MIYYNISYFTSLSSITNITRRYLAIIAALLYIKVFSISGESLGCVCVCENITFYIDWSMIHCIRYTISVTLAISWFTLGKGISFICLVKKMI